MNIRTRKERIIQTISFEVVGLIIFSPLLAYAASEDAAYSFALVGAMALAAMIVTAAFNTAFDVLEFKRLGTLASNRSFAGRAIHAVLLEVAIALATVPIIKYWMDLEWIDALLVDVLLAAGYITYSYAFHLIYDRIRPVKISGRSDMPSACDEGWDRLSGILAKIVVNDAVDTPQNIIK